MLVNDCEKGSKYHVEFSICLHFREFVGDRGICEHGGGREFNKDNFFRLLIELEVQAYPVMIGLLKFTA